MKDAVTVWVRNRFQDDVSLFTLLIGNGNRPQTDSGLLRPLRDDIR